MLGKYLVLLLLLLLHNPASCLQAENNIFHHRGAGTSLPLATGKGSKQVHMQVCITVGCCHHVCRQFMDDSTSDSQAQQTALAPFASQSTPERQQQQHADDASSENLLEMVVINEHVALVPSVLEWTPRVLFSPSIKFLRVLNTGNTSWIGISKPVCTDEQFSVQDIDSTAIAPGDSLTIPVVFIPRKVGAIVGRISLKTSAGTVVSHLRGEGKSSPYHLPNLMGIDAVVGRPLTRRITFHNPHDDGVEIDEVQVWPGDSYNKALCLSDEAEGRITSCFADNFPKAAVSKTRYEKYSLDGSISLKPLDSWKIRSQETAQIVELEMSVMKDWTGLVYLKFSRNAAEEVIILPLKLKMVSESDAATSGTVAAPKIPDTRIDGVPVSSGKWMPTTDLVALKVAESLLKDLSHTLLRPSQIKKGSLAANRNEPLLVSEEQLSFQTVQTGLKENLWINLLNPTNNPIVVNLILPSEVKSRNCRYRANWFWQGQKPQLHRQNDVFFFEAGAVTEAIIPEQGKVELGPLTFHSKHKCDWSGLVLIKNNATGLEWIPLRGRAGSAKLLFIEKDLTTRRLEVVIDHSRNDQEVCSRTVEKTVQVKNAGDLPLHVYGMDLMEAPWITLKGKSSFTLAVGETTDVTVFYGPDFQQGATKQVIKLATSTGVVKLPVVAKIPRTLVALCKNSPFHEKLVLPVSVCALVLVLGVFFWLLLQELPTKPLVNKEDFKISEWKKTWSNVAGFWKAKNVAPKKPKLRLEESGIVTLTTFHQELTDKCKMRKKKKSKSISSPRSQSSSSNPGSPRSGSDSELPSIERILNSSRFSEVKATTTKKSNTQISLVRKEVVLNQAAWDAKLEVTTEPRNIIQNAADNQIRKSSTSCKAPSVTDATLRTPAPSAPATASSPASSPARAPKRRENESEKTWKTIESGNRTSNNAATTDQAADNGMLKQAADNGMLKQAADNGMLKQSEPLYDIWGDHLSDIFTAFSSPNSPHHFTGSNQSFFSQSLELPTRTAHNYHDFGSSCFVEKASEVHGHRLLLPSSEDPFTVPGNVSSADNFQITSSANLLSFLPPVETYAVHPEPPFIDWNTSSIYRLAVSEIS